MAQNHGHTAARLPAYSWIKKMKPNTNKPTEWRNDKENAILEPHRHKQNTKLEIENLHLRHSHDILDKIWCKIILLKNTIIWMRSYGCVFLCFTFLWIHWIHFHAFKASFRIFCFPTERTWPSYRFGTLLNLLCEAPWKCWIRCCCFVFSI